MRKFTLFLAALLISMTAFSAKLYLTPNANWKNDNARFAAYFFGNGEKWISMTKVAGETDLYEVEAPAGYPNVIFCRMNPSASANNWNNKWNQTADLKIPTNTQNHYTVKEGTWDKGGGTWTVYAPEAPKTYKDITITITANAQPKIHYWEGGDKMVGSDWESKPDMIATTEANTYSYTIKDVDAATGVKYLIVVGDFQSVDLHTVDNVTANFKECLPQVAVMGVRNWDGTDKMVVADDYKTASIALNLTAKSYAWKLTVNGEWFGGSKYVITRDENSLNVTDDAGGDGKLTADIAGEYVFTYTYATKNLTVTYPVQKYTVSATANNAEWGTITGAGSYASGTEVTLTATPAEGYEFVKWTKNETEVSTDAAYTFTVTENVTLVAVFEESAPEVVPTIVAGTKLYLKADVMSTTTPRVAFGECTVPFPKNNGLSMNGGSTGTTTYAMTKVDEENGIWEIEAPEGISTTVFHVAFYDAMRPTTPLGYISPLTYDGTNNFFTYTGAKLTGQAIVDATAGTWSKYEAAVTPDPEEPSTPTIVEGTKIYLQTSLTSYKYNVVFGEYEIPSSSGSGTGIKPSTGTGGLGTGTVVKPSIPGVAMTKIDEERGIWEIVAPEGTSESEFTIAVIKGTSTLFAFVQSLTYDGENDLFVLPETFTPASGSVYNATVGTWSKYVATPANPVIAIAEGVVTFSCETEGAKIMYAFVEMGAELTDAMYQEYTAGALEVNNGSYTVYAYAVNGTLKSEVVSMRLKIDNGVAVDAEVVTIAEIFVQNRTIVTDGEFQIFTVTGQNVTDMNGALVNGVYVVRTANAVAKVVVR